MTDDEAFIRAIVDRPGDDLPRLVYADWLDERGDPRGEYLRAEMENVRRFQESSNAQHLMMWLATAGRLAEPLDPVWVARVSRPPVGVCCDHIRFTESGPPLAAADVETFERRIGGQLATDFRAFLLNYNGGKPDPPHLPSFLEIGTFYSADRPDENHPPGTDEGRSLDIESQRQWLADLHEVGGGGELLIAGMIPVADTLHDLGYLLLAVTGPTAGTVFHFRNYCHHSDDPDHLNEFTPRFADLLALIKTDPDTD
jgi:uncharacterized protein (TIGR02996 family)